MSYASGQIVHASDMSGQIIASWKTTPSLTSVTTEVDVLNVSWTPPAVGCYRFQASIPYDVSAAETDAKLRVRINGTEVDNDLRTGVNGVFVAKLRLDCTQDITSTVARTLRVTVERASGAATLNSRLVEARLEVFRAGDTGIRA